MNDQNRNPSVASRQFRRRTPLSDCTYCATSPPPDPRDSVRIGQPQPGVVYQGVLLGSVPLPPQRNQEFSYPRHGTVNCNMSIRRAAGGGYEYPCTTMQNEHMWLP